MEKKGKNKWKSRFFAIILFFIVVFLILTLWSRNHHWQKMTESHENYGIRNALIKGTILDLQSMCERRSWENQAKTSRYLQRRLEGFGLKPSIQRYIQQGKTWENVYVTFKSETHQNSRILAVAHYDSTSTTGTVDAPGGDDNATGVAAVLELARMLRQHQFQNTVQLAFFSNEEHGRHGSHAFAKKLKEERVDVRGVINVDIVGYNAPMAIFSSQVFGILGGEFSLRRKAKMLVKMGYNWITHVLNPSKALKLMAREKDRHFIPDESWRAGSIGKSRVKWIIGDICV